MQSMDCSVCIGDLVCGMDARDVDAVHVAPEAHQPFSSVGSVGGHASTGAVALGAHGACGLGSGDASGVMAKESGMPSCQTKENIQAGMLLVLCTLHWGGVCDVWVMRGYVMFN